MRLFGFIIAVAGFPVAPRLPVATPTPRITRREQHPNSPHARLQILRQCTPAVASAGAESLLCEMDESGLTTKASPNRKHTKFLRSVYNAALSLCASDASAAQRVFDRLKVHGFVDDGSWAVLLRAKVADGALGDATSALLRRINDEHTQLSPRVCTPVLHALCAAGDRPSALGVWRSSQA